MVERASHVSRQNVFNKNSAGLKNGPELFNRIRKIVTDTTFILAVLGFVTGRVSILNALSPFGVAFLVSVALVTKTSNTTVIGTSIIVGLLTKINGYQTVQSILSIMLIFLAIKVLKLNDSSGTLKAAIAAFAANFAAALIINLLTHGTLILYDTLTGLFNSTIVMALVYIYNYSVPVIINRKRRNILSNEEVICLSIFCAVLIAGMSDFSIYTISIKTVLSVFVVAVVAFSQGSAVGAAAGTTIGLITCISSNQAPVVIGTFALCGLFAGLFKEMGKIGSSLAFIMADLSILFYLGIDGTVIDIVELSCGLLLFSVFPSSVIGKIVPFINGGEKVLIEQQSYVERMKDITRARIGRVVDVFTQLAKTLDENENSKKLRQRGEVNAIINSVADKVCSECDARNICWSREFYRTYQSMFEMLDSIQIDGKVDMENLPVDFKSRCLKVKDMIKTTNYMFDIYRMNYKWRQKAEEGKKVIGEQLQGAAGILKVLSDEIRQEINFNDDIEEELAVSLDKAGIQFNDVVVAKDDEGKYEVNIYKRACLGRRECIKDVSPVISKILKRKMKRDKAFCMIKEGTNLCCFKLIEAVRFQVSTGVAKVAKDESGMSGDNYSFIELDGGKYMLALSDGMGTGPIAAVESNAAITLLEKYLEAGFDRFTALKAINSSMALKSQDDNFATIDLAVIDLYSGEIEITKIGAASTYIRRMDGTIETVNSDSFPIGILDSISIESSKIKLSHGDLVIMITDGIEDAGSSDEKWILHALEQIDSRNPQQIADELLAKARERSGSTIGDDMSVLVSKLWEVT